MVKRGVGSTKSDVSGELSNAAFLVEALVARPVIGGDDGVKEVFTGVTKGSSSVSGASSVISLSCAWGSSMSVMASSSSMSAVVFSLLLLGNRRRGLIEERVTGR